MQRTLERFRALPEQVRWAVIGAAIFGVVTVTATAFDALWDRDPEDNRWAAVGVATVLGAVLGATFSSKPIKDVQRWFGRIVERHRATKISVKLTYGLAIWGFDPLGIGQSLGGGALPDFIGTVVSVSLIDLSVLAIYGRVTGEPFRTEETHDSAKHVEPAAQPPGGWPPSER